MAGRHGACHPHAPCRVRAALRGGSQLKLPSICLGARRVAERDRRSCPAQTPARANRCFRAAPPRKSACDGDGSHAHGHGVALVPRFRGCCRDPQPGPAPLRTPPPATQGGRQRRRQMQAAGHRRACSARRAARARSRRTLSHPLLSPRGGGLRAPTTRAHSHARGTCRHRRWASADSFRPTCLRLFPVLCSPRRMPLHLPLPPYPPPSLAVPLTQREPFFDTAAHGHGPRSATAVTVRYRY